MGVIQILNPRVYFCRMNKTHFNNFIPISFSFEFLSARPVFLYLRETAAR